MLWEAERHEVDNQNYRPHSVAQKTLGCRACQRVKTAMSPCCARIAICLQCNGRVVGGDWTATQKKMLEVLGPTARSRVSRWVRAAKHMNLCCILEGRVAQRKICYDVCALVDDTTRSTQVLEYLKSIQTVNDVHVFDNPSILGRPAERLPVAKQILALGVLGDQQKEIPVTGEDIGDKTV